jgi:putative membrane protein insertion efficiency factor
MSSAQSSHNPAVPAIEIAGSRQRALALAFRGYKALLSPLVHAVSPSRCLYLPTCSEYAYTALVRFGLLRGSWLALRRLTRCHPWGNGGFDPVPPLAAQSPAAPNPAATRANHLP